MKTLRSTLTGATILVLLAAGGIGVLAQDDAADAEQASEAQVSEVPVVVTGTLDCTDGAGESDEPIGQSVMTVHAWQATDPRLSGEASFAGHWQLYDVPSEDAGDPETAADTAVYEIVNDGGGWLCEASRTALPRTGDATHTLVFSGSDEYEGLTAYLHVDWSTTPFTFSGLIMQGEAPAWAPPAE